MSNHTVGPWVFDEYVNGQLEIVASGGLPQYGGKILVANVLYSDEREHCYVNCTGQRDANARLISAAPELLEALQLLLEREPAILCGASKAGFDLSDRFRIASAAIAKATKP